MSVDDAVELAIRAIYSAMKRDSASGDGIDVVKITEKEFYQFKPEEIEEIISKFKK